MVSEALIGVIAAVCSWGFFTTPMKLAPKTAPIVFQVYMSLGIVASSFAVLIMHPWALTLEWGAVAAAVWTTGSIFSVQAVADLGLSVGQGVWSGAVALTAFFWGYAGHAVFGGTAYAEAFPPCDMPHQTLAVCSLGVLCVGILIVSLVSDGGSEPEPAVASTEERRSLLSPGDAAFSRKAIYEIANAGGAGDASAPQKANKARGLACAALTGIFGGSVLVPLKMAPLVPFQHGTNASIFALSFGLCIMPVTLCFLALAYAGAMLGWCETPRFGAEHPLGRELLAGVAAGALWNGGNVASIYAIQAPLGMAVGYPLTQCALLVSGTLGIVAFGEIKGKRVLLWVLGAGILLAGASGLGIYGG